MQNALLKKIKNVGCVAAVVAAAASFSTAAQANDKISGSAHVSYNSHFVSYGLDVWGGGTGFYGNDSTMFLTTDITFDLEPITLTAGVWGDINNNLTSGVGGGIQEVDVWIGASADIGKFNFGVTFQQWYYASDTEGVLDFTLSYDDSDFLPIALNPSLTLHARVEGNGAQSKSSALVLGIAPSFTLIESDTAPLTVDIPAGVAFFLDKDFQGGNKSGVGYFYIGTSFSMPLSFISADYGEWAINLDLMYYNTSPRAIPGNVKDDFLTGSIGLGVAF